MEGKIKQNNNHPEKKKTVILVAAHKPFQMPADQMYLPVHVGAEGKDSIGFQRDDEGKNISALNPFFCELTALYWGWKNLHADYMGLAHYRRHFAGNTKGDLWQRVLKKDEIEEDLKSIRIFVPEKRNYYVETLYSHYAHTHDEKQLLETRKILQEKYPASLQVFDCTLRQKSGHMFNMMIMEWELLDTYCTWLFDILFELRKRLGENGLTSFQRRYYGRVSELLFNVWLNEQLSSGAIHPDEIREIPVIHMEKTDWKKKGMRFLKAKFFGKKYDGNPVT